MFRDSSQAVTLFLDARQRRIDRQVEIALSTSQLERVPSIRRAPAEASAWVTWAYATRRADSLQAAEKILLEAEHHHPAEPTIQFNLGCYACLRGDLDVARRRVDRAIALDKKFAAAAATDPDLGRLRGAGSTDCQPTP